jgi:glycosyltransferase involved in cell wall biosynthesis
MVHAVGRLPVQVRNRVRVIVVGAPVPDCAGDINYAADLRAEAARYSLEETIAWVGYQSDPAPFYALMDVLLHPALSEALCLAILEALEAGVPVIAARTGGNPEIITEGRNGLLTPPEDLEALTAAIGRFVEDAALRSRLEAGARLGLDGRFSPGGFQSSVRSLVGELCGGRRGPGSRFVKPQPRAQVAGRPRESPPVRARSRPRF